MTSCCWSASPGDSDPGMRPSLASLPWGKRLLRSTYFTLAGGRMGQYRPVPAKQGSPLLWGVRLGYPVTAAGVRTSRWASAPAARDGRDGVGEVERESGAIKAIAGLAWTGYSANGACVYARHGRPTGWVARQQVGQALVPANRLLCLRLCLSDVPVLGSVPACRPQLPRRPRPPGDEPP